MTYFCGKCKKNLPTLHGLEFHWSWRKLRKSGKESEMGWALDIEAMGRGAIEEKFGEGPWGDRLCEDCKI
jgi:hypothetical protein